MEYRLAHEVKRIADDLVWDHHDHLSGLGIVYVMTRLPGGKAPKRMFSVRKVTGLNAFLALEKKPGAFAGDTTAAPGSLLPQADPFVVVEVAQFWWGALEPWQRKGLMDHALSHLTFDPENETWSIEGPEFGEFADVLERNGDWRPTDHFKRWARRVQDKLPLIFEDREEDGGGGGVGDQENLSVTISHGGRTVETDTGTMRKLAGGDFLEGPNGEKVDAETGEVLERAPA